MIYFLGNPNGNRPYKKGREMVTLAHTSKSKTSKERKKLHEVNQELTSESRKLSDKATAVHMDPFLFARITLALLHNVHIQILAKIRRRSEEVIF